MEYFTSETLEAFLIKDPNKILVTISIFNKNYIVINIIFSMIISW